MKNLCFASPAIVLTKVCLAFIIHHSSFIINLPAQPTVEWQKCLGGTGYEHATSIRQTGDGGFVVAGQTSSNDGDVAGNHGIVDFWVVKLDNSGAIQWEKALGGGYIEQPRDIELTNDGGFIVAGLTKSDDGQVSGFHGEDDAWVVKLSSTGVIEWQRALGGSGWDEANSVELTQDGGYVIAGASHFNDGDVSGNHGGTDFWLVKLSSTGQIVWQRSLGGSNDDRALSIKGTSEGGYIVVGETYSNDVDVSGNNGNVDLWVVKIGTTGEIEWQNALGGLGLDVASDVVESTDGFVVCGYAATTGNSGDITGGHGSLDYWIVKLSKAGELLWQKAYGGSDFDYARSIVQTSDGMFVVTGEAKSTDGDFEGNTGIQIIWVLKLNEMGELLWKKPLGGTQGEGGKSIIQTSDSGYIMAGYAWSNDGDVSGNHGSADFWVVKLAPESVGVEDPPAPAEQLAIYPNPASSTVTFRSDTFSKSVTSDTALSVRITDLLGREMIRHEIANGGQLDISSLPKGMYLVVATAPSSGKAYIGKVCKD